MNRQIRRSYSPIAESETDNFAESVAQDEAVSSVHQAKLERTHITQLNRDQLRPGDHIGWARVYLIYHHAIVDDTSDIDQGRIKVFNYDSVSKNNGCKVKVVHADIDLNTQNGVLFKFNYSTACLKKNPANKVLERAAELEGERGYNFLLNNCEHFASYCKIGVKQCAQTKFLAVQGMRTAVEILASDVACGVVRLGIDVDAIKAATSAGKVILSEGFERVVKGSNLIGAGIMVVLVTGQCVYDIYKMHKKYKSGQMEKSDFQAEVTEQVVKGVAGVGCSVGLSIAGQALGMMVGSPIGSVIPGIGTVVCGFVGAVVGGVIGNIIGKVLGSFLGRWLGNWLFRKNKQIIRDTLTVVKKLITSELVSIKLLKAKLFQKKI